MKTNLKEIKDLAKAFLHLPLGETEMSPMIMTHPFFTSDHALVGDGDVKNAEFLEIWKNKENFNRACKPIEDAIDRATDVMGIMILIRPPYYGAFVKYACPFLSKEDFADVLSTAWVEEENPNMDANVSIEEWVELFKRADPKLLMTEEDYAHWEKLRSAENNIDVFRGVGNGRVEKGLSWTEDIEKAKWFANRFGGEGVLLKSECCPQDILAYFNTRGENEVVVSPREYEYMLFDITYNEPITIDFEKETVNVLKNHTELDEEGL